MPQSVLNNNIVKMNLSRKYVSEKYQRITGVAIDVISINSTEETAVLKLENIRNQCFI